MNRYQRRAGAARERTALDRAGAIRLASACLANVAAPTATGVTLFLPDGGTAYVSAEDARALHGKGKLEGRA